MRIFVGIGLDENIKKELEGLQKEIKTVFSKISTVRLENLHLTFKFLGEISEEKCKEFIEAFENALSDIKQVTVQLKGFGTFPENSNPRVLWIGISANSDFLDIVKMTEESAAGIGIAKERNLKGHITIARNKNKIDKKEIEKLKQKFNDTVWGNMLIDHIDILESELKPQGSEYRIIKTITLGDMNNG